jgi:Zn-dependent protease with chaperone function
VASIEEFPRVSQVGYFKSAPFADFMDRYARVTSPDTPPEKRRERIANTAFDENAEFFSELNREYQKVLADVQQILNHPAVPVPRLVIAKNATPNAYVTALSDCFNQKIAVVGAFDSDKLKPNMDGALDVIPYSLSFRGMSQSNDNKNYARISQPTQDVMFLSGKPKCISVQGDHSLELLQDLSFHPLNYTGAACSMRSNEGIPRIDCPERAMNRVFQQISIERTIPFVFVHAGLIASLHSFAEFRAIVAHELGHYYLGHGYPLTIPRSYFYDREGNTQAFRPPEDRNLKRIGDALLAVGSLKPGRTIPGMFSHSVGGEVLLSALRNIADNPSKKWKFNRKKCAVFNKESDAGRRYLFATELTPQEEKRGLEYFRQAKECTQTIVSADGKDPAYDEYLTSMPPKLMLMDYLVKDFHASPSRNAWEAFQKIEPVMARRMAELHASAELRRVGYYTFEEEADVFALNYLLSTGRPAQDLQKGLMSMMKTEVNGHKLSAEDRDCITAAENQWQLNGAPYTPLPLDYVDFHHGICFRLFSVDNYVRRLGEFKTLNEAGEERTYAPVRERYGTISKTLEASSSASRSSK